MTEISKQKRRVYYQQWVASNLERVRAYNKAYHAAHREQRKLRHSNSYPHQRTAILEKRRRKKFGINSSQFAELLFQQGGGCAICQSKDSGIHDFAVDHNHQTGEIRGLLCHRCNGGLGMFQDNVNLLNAAITYLQANFAKNAIEN